MQSPIVIQLTENIISREKEKTTYWPEILCNKMTAITSITTPSMCTIICRHTDISFIH